MHLEVTSIQSDAYLYQLYADAYSQPTLSSADLAFVRYHYMAHVQNTVMWH